MFDYDIKGKHELDKIIRQQLIKFEELGRTPTRIYVSPQMYDKLNRVFPIKDSFVIEFGYLPVIKDESLTEEQIVIQ